MSYLESESDFKFASNSASDSNPDSNSDSSSVFMNLEMCIFFIFYLHSSKQTCG